MQYTQATIINMENEQFDLTFSLILLSSPIVRHPFTVISENFAKPLNKFSDMSEVNIFKIVNKTQICSGFPLVFEEQTNI